VKNRKRHKQLQTQASLKKVSESTFNKSILPGGIRVVSEYIPHVRSVSLGFWVEVGTRDEASEVNGISHFIEHMLFKGTKRRSAAEIARSLEDVGGTLNAFTSKELTCFYAHFLDNDLPLAVDVLSDMLINSIFAPEEIRKEKDVILEEIKSMDDVPEERIHDYFYQDLFGDHPLSRPTLGTRESLKKISRKAALDYMKANYTRNRLVVAASGNIRHQDLCDLLAGQFDGWDNHSVRTLTPPRPNGSYQKVREEDVAQAHICLGTQAFAFSDERKYAALIMNTILGAGMGSRLFQSVREMHGLCYSIYSYLEFMADTGVFCIYTGTDKDNIDLALELIHQELEKLKTEGLDKDELQRTKSQLKGNLMLSLESTSSRMNRLAKMEIYLQEYYTLDDVLKGIENVTQDDVLEVSNDLLSADRLVTSMIKPK